MTEQISEIGLADVQAAYGTSEGDLSELIMGEQIHIGGMISSQELAELAGIGSGMAGVDLCCCTGAGMRFLVRFRNVAHMVGVDATERMIQRGRKRCEQEGLANQIDFLLADACRSGLRDESADFVWGEDAWCYVSDKPRLIAEAARIVRPSGAIAFTDWLAGPASMSHDEAERLLRFMTFPSLLTRDEYTQLLEANGCQVEAARDTGRFAAYIDLYRQMITMQLTYDALKLIGFDQQRMRALEEGRRFIQELAHDRKLTQGMFVARKVTRATRRSGR